jgi:type VI secretion system protein ImpF
MASPADRVAGISSAQDRVQPSLLDRLTDDDPMNRRDGRDMRGFSLARLRDSVLRDLSWLMNASQLAATRDLGRLPHVAASVLNYGIPPTTGKVKAAIDAAALARNVRIALLRFEPRLLPHSLRVSVIRETNHDGAFQFVIDAELWAHPVPLRMTLRTEPDRDLDMVRVVEQGGGGV